MDSFNLSRASILPIVQGLITEQLGRSDKTERTRLSDVDWHENLALGSAGLCMDHSFIGRCKQSVADFFDIPIDRLNPIGENEPLTIWIDHVTDQLQNSMRRFNFRPAGRGDDEVSYFHRADMLYQDAAAAAGLLQGRRRMVSLVSPHSLMGFVVTVLTPRLQDIDVLDARGFSPEEFSTNLAFGDVIVATPSLWSYMIREGMSAPDNTMGVSFGEMMTPELGEKMRRKGVGVMREFYGSTETGLVGWRDSSTDHFMLFDHWSHREHGLERLTPGGDVELVEAMDFLNWQSDRSFSLEGRRDGAIQIGAINVFPDRVAAIIANHSSIKSCAIRVAGTATGANRLVADITLTPGTRPSETIARDIDSFMRKELAVQERPQIYNFF